MTKQIKLEFKGTYQIDDKTSVTDPIVSCIGALDNMINSVSISCNFENENYSYSREIGSFEYDETWGNEDVINYIKEYLKEK